MQFKEFNTQIQKQFAIMCATGKLFRVDMTGDDLWDIYLASYSKEYDPIFRDPNSTNHTCNQCKNFIRRYGNVVAINDEGNLISMFTNIDVDGEYINTASTMHDIIVTHPIKDIFLETYSSLNETNYESVVVRQKIYQLGLAKNVKRYTKEEAELYGVVEPYELKTFYHFNVQLPSRFVDISGKSIEQLTAKYRDKYSVFKRVMSEISLDTLNLVKDLINQGSLLDGTAHLHSIDEIITQAFEFKEILKAPHIVNNWFWSVTYGMEERTAKFRNTLIGVLCSELSEGMELNKACLNWNKRVDPANYHKVTAPITKKHIENAKVFVSTNGYESAFDRRLATIDDINVSEILHVNVGTGAIASASIFDNVKSTSTRHKRSEFNKVEEVSIVKFMSDILPQCTSVEVYLENRMDGNMCVLTKASDDESKSIFKWANNYGYTFNGNLAGKSQIKEAIKAKGGIVDGVLRFSINWGEGSTDDNSDLDAWASEPNGTRIGFDCGFRKDDGNRRTHMSGQLDVDIKRPSHYFNKNIVENIAWNDISKMKDGIYILWVNQYSSRNSKGFSAEIEVDGNIYTYEYNKPIAQNDNILVANVILKDGKFTVDHKLPQSNSNKELWGLESNNFHKVNLACLSPNHWGENAVGNIYYMFMLDDCKAEGSIRSFHNEHLIPDLTAHRKVMEVLGATNMIEPNGKHLAGLGFNSTVKDELVVRCKGSFNRVLKIKF